MPQLFWNCWPDWLCLQIEASMIFYDFLWWWHIQETKHPIYEANLAWPGHRQRHTSLWRQRRQGDKGNFPLKSTGSFNGENHENHDLLEMFFLFFKRRLSFMLPKGKISRRLQAHGRNCWWFSPAMIGLLAAWCLGNGLGLIWHQQTFFVSKLNCLVVWNMLDSQPYYGWYTTFTKMFFKRFESRQVEATKRSFSPNALSFAVEYPTSLMPYQWWGLESLIELGLLNMCLYYKEPE